MREEDILKYKTLLIVEDSDDDYEYMMQAIEESEFQNPIHRCINGKEAISYLQREKEMILQRGLGPGIIMLDLNMDGLHGKKVLSFIKSDEVLMEIPVVIMSTSSDKSDIHECYQFGANTYIQKPYHLDQFLDVFKRLLQYWFQFAKLPRSEVQ